MSSLHLRGIQMIPEKIKLQKYLKIRKGTKNVRNLNILRTLPILNFFDALKKFWDIVWLGYCLNDFMTRKGCSNDAQKNQTPKILKNSKGYEECEES